MLAVILNFFMTRLSIIIGIILLVVAGVKVNGYMSGVADQVDFLTEKYEAVADEHNKMLKNILETQKAITTSLEAYENFEDKLANTDFVNDCVGDAVNSALDFLHEGTDDPTDSAPKNK